jgi:peroxiredoxin/Tfp pilus assembly protein PilF
MRRPGIVIFVAISMIAQQSPELPANEKAQKTYKEGLDYLHKGEMLWALEDFKKADKQDGGHCSPCQRQMIQYGTELRQWKTAEAGAEAMVAAAQGPRDTAIAHYQFGIVLLNEGADKHKDEFFAHAHDEFTNAIKLAPNFSGALFADGRALAYLKQDDAARARFQQFSELRSADDPTRQRALRFVSHPELARARMAPAFEITTTDGQKISMDNLQGKVVLIDFWATWCPPCREAVPHIREIAKKFHDQPLVILSVSLDDDQQRWKEFVAKNEMTWPQYRDGGFKGEVARLFGVEAIPHTFTIDADGVLQDEHIGDSSLEGKLKKLVARAREAQAAQNTMPQQ